MNLKGKLSMSTGLMEAESKVKTALANVQNKAIPAEQRMKAFADLIRLRGAAITQGVPAGVDRKRLVETACNVLLAQPALLECTVKSVVDRVREAFVRGLEIGKEVYLIPRRNRRKLPGGEWVDVVECTSQQSWRGDMKLVERSGEVLAKRLGFIYQGEHVSIGEYPDGLKRIDHAEDIFNGGRQADDDAQIVAIYWRFVMRNGTKIDYYMTRGEIEAHKDQYSDAFEYAERGKKDSFWHTSWREGGAKTVLKQMVARGLLPVSEEDRRFIVHGSADASTIIAEFSISEDAPSVPAIEQADLDPQSAATSSVGRVEAQARDAVKQLEAVEPTAVTLDEFRRAIADCHGMPALAQVAKELGERLPEADKEAGREAVKAKKAELRAADSDGAMGDRP